MLKSYKVLTLLIVMPLALAGCSESLAKLFESKPKQPKRGEIQRSRDPSGPMEKGQHGLDYKPHEFVEEMYNPDSVKVRITSPGINGLTRQTFAAAGGDHNVHLEKDGKWMLFATTRYSRTPQICRQSVEGKAVQLITQDRASDMMPKFAPDAQQVVWCSNRTGSWSILYKNLKSGPNAAVRQLTRSSDDDIHPTWSPDGKLIAFSRYNSIDGQWQIWVMDFHNNTISSLTEGIFPEFRPVMGKKNGAPLYTIAYQRHRKRDVPWYSIWTTDISMGKTGKVEAVSAPQEIVSSDQWAAINPCWSPDGEYLAFATVRKSPLAKMQARIYRADDIWVVKIDGTDLTQITSHSAPDWYPCWAKEEGNPAGRIYFTSSRSGHPNIWSVKPIVAGMLARETESKPATTAPAVEKQ